MLGNQERNQTKWSKLNAIGSGRSRNWTVLKVNGLEIVLSWKWTGPNMNDGSILSWIMTIWRPYLFNKCTWLGCKEVTCSTKNLQWMFYMTGDLTTIKQVQFELSSRNWKKEKRHECFNQPQSYYISHSINLHSSLSNQRMKNHLSQPLSN